MVNNIHQKTNNSESDKTDPKKSGKKRFLRTLGLVLIMSGLAVIGYPASTFFFANSAQSDLRSDWDKIVQKAAENVTENPPSTNEETETPDENRKEPTNGKNIPDGKVAFRILIPKLNLDKIVVKGVDKASLKLGPGHMAKTVYPGEPGVCVISGHRTTYGAPFFRLDRLDKGDQIIIETVKSKYVYIVYDKMEVKPNNTSFIEKNGEPRIALTTCTPIHSARRRLVILAELRE